MGEGGLGEVWRAHDIINGRLVALRILPVPPPGDPFRFARFEGDIRNVVRLRHPNVARLYELVDAGGVRALACEWVTGDSLAARIAAGPIRVDETIRIIAQVANGLAAAHSCDVVHGDVKPSNIRLCVDEVVKVIDLGLLEVYEPVGMMPSSDVWPAPSARLLGAITGTAAYMSPEQIAGHAADSRADVWAFGCVLYEMLTGKSAFAADDVSETMARVAGAEPEWALLPPAAPPLLVRMLRRCLDRDPHRRFQRLTEVLGTIRATIGQEHATEAFMRQPVLRRMAPAPVAPVWTNEGVQDTLERLVPALRRWARGLLPRGSELNVDDLVQEVVSKLEEKIAVVRPRFDPDHAGLLGLYMRESVSKRIRNELRREQSSPFEEALAPASYGDALKELAERDQQIIKSRFEANASYDQIAARFSFRSAAAARRAISRALRRLVDRLGRKRD